MEHDDRQLYLNRVTKRACFGCVTHVVSTTCRNNLAQKIRVHTVCFFMLSCYEVQTKVNYTPAIHTAFVSIALTNPSTNYTLTTFFEKKEKTNKNIFLNLIYNINFKIYFQNSK